MSSGTTIRLLAALSSLFLAAASHAQLPQITTTVPRLVRFTGSLSASGRSSASIESVTLSVYRDQSGGTPLWQEVQNVQVDSEGRYSLLMGSTLNDGMPTDLFNSGEPRWLAVQVNTPGEVEQPRVLMVSVPYALKASDADTLGGKPASAYQLATLPAGSSSAVANTLAAPLSSAASLTNVTNAVKPHLSAGLPNFLAKFVNSTDLTPSVLFENGGMIGVGTGQPLIGFDVRAGQFPQLGTAQTTDYLSFFASDQFGPAIYWDPQRDLRFGRGGQGLYNPFGFGELMRIQSSTGYVGIGTQLPISKLDVAGDINFAGIIKLQSLPVFNANAANSNVAVGINAMQQNFSGKFDTAIGQAALSTTVVGMNNTAIGSSALSFIEGNSNTAIGSGAGVAVTTGSNNTFIGAAAGANSLANLSNVTVIGGGANATRNNVMILGGTGFGSVSVGIGTTNPVAGWAVDVETSSLGGIVNGILVDSQGGDIYVGETSGVHKFRVDHNGTTYANGGYQTVGADFAESMDVAPAKSPYQPGDLLIIDRDSNRRLALSQKPYSTLVAGIYSTKPGLLASPHSIDEDLSGEVPLAVVGIVPCKVSAENGPIHRGDLLVTSSRPGFAMKGTHRKRMLGAVVGKALEPLPNGTGVIQVLVTLQ